MLPAVSYLLGERKGYCVPRTDWMLLQMMAECFPEQLSWSSDPPAAGGRAACEVGSIVLLLFQNVTEVVEREAHCVFVDVCKEILKRLHVNRNV